MAVEVKQLVVKGTVLQEQTPAPKPELPSVCRLDEEEIHAESLRLWREEQRQRKER